MRLFMVLLGFFAFATAAVAQEAKPALSIELNDAKTNEQSCTLTFLIENTLAADLDGAVFETVLFDTDGAVNRLTLFDFGSLPKGRSRVRQFAIPQVACDGLGRILFNGAKTCSGGDLTVADCEKAIVATSRTSIEILG